MALRAFLDSLQECLSPASQILTDQSNQDFKASAQRWSNIDIKVPGAILKPGDEQDTITVVSKEGGHP